MVHSRPIRHAAAALVALAIAAIVVAIANPAMGDYLATDAASDDDNAAPALAALIEGDLARALEVQPVMGPVTVVLRWPFAAAGQALGGPSAPPRASRSWPCSRSASRAARVRPTGSCWPVPSCYSCWSRTP
jgi:hypothetical protein